MSKYAWARSSLVPDSLNVTGTNSDNFSNSLEGITLARAGRSDVEVGGGDATLASADKGSKFNPAAEPVPVNIFMTSSSDFP